MSDEMCQLLLMINNLFGTAVLFQIVGWYALRVME